MDISEVTKCKTLFYYLQLVHNIDLFIYVLPATTIHKHSTGTNDCKVLRLASV